MHTFEHNYPSDITREQFAIIQQDLESTKKVSGIKRHIVVDTQGPPHAL